MSASAFWPSPSTKVRCSIFQPNRSRKSRQRPTGGISSLSPSEARNTSDVRILALSADEKDGQTTRPSAPQGTTAGDGGGGNGGRFKHRSPTLRGNYRKVPAGAQPAAESAPPAPDLLADLFNFAPIPSPRTRARGEITPAPAPPTTATVGPQEGEQSDAATGGADGSGPRRVSFASLWPFGSRS